MEILFIVGRILLALVFIMSGINHTFKPGSAGAPVPKFVESLGGLTALLGGLSLIFGYQMIFGALLLIGFLIIITPMGHAFWKITDPMQKMMEMANFMKNVALIGALLVIVYFIV